jgi:HEAT repeat protein
MKHLIKAKLGGLLVIMIVLVSVSFLTAQNKSIKEITSNKYALQNLLAGIKSNNEGVQRSCIYFAGKYKIAETASALIDQLKIEENPSTRILIALVLYELGSLPGIAAVKELALSDIDPEVRRMSTHIYNEFLVNDFDSFATVNK